MTVTSETAATCPFMIDDSIARYARTKAVAFTSTSKKLAAGAAGGLVGGLILSQHAQSEFFARLTTPPGEYILSVSERGLGIARPGLSESLWRWSDIDAWAADERLFMAQDVAGNTIIVPRAAIPEQIFSMILEICSLTLKGNKTTISRVGFSKWAQLGLGEKIVRGFVYSVGALVVVLSLLIFATAGLPS